MAPAVKAVAQSLSSSITAAPRFPYRFSEWKDALLDVKVLYIKSQYRQCATRSEQLIDGAGSRLHQVHAIYLHFYAATSLETTADSIHPLSTNKLPLLETAKMHYLIAGSMLPAPIVPQASPPPSPASTLTIETAFPSTPRRSFSTASEDSPITPSFVSSSTCFSFPPSEDEILKPSPLRIRKTNSVSASSSPIYETLTPAPLQPRKTSTPSLPPQETYCGSDRYSTNLQALSTQITVHLSNLNSTIARTVEDQTARRVKHFADLRNARFDEDLRAMDRQARIGRLREQGWCRERFNPGKYQDLARTALGEL
ncbi:MAG: hypothetical protein M1837_001825 [Sclerophora amabilis]|nr:MAG: hypothetical protein M1837_001825 [Sclerophora amabilis]